MKAISVTGVNVFYDQVQALENIDLEVEDKEFLGVLGPNGAGKSTLLKLILGLVKPTTGEVRIFGSRVEEKRDILGYVPQGANFNQQFPISVLDVVLMGRLENKLQLFKSYSQADKEKAVSLLKKLEIYELKDRQIGQLSGGQLQKVLIARALAVEPEILLLDEPTASIDTETKTEIYSLLKKLNQEMTVVIVTHDMSAVSSYFDSIACLNQTLYYHGEKELDKKTVNQVYGCPIDLIAHGVPHRVLTPHLEEGYDD